MSEKLDDIIKKANLTILYKTTFSSLNEKERELRHWDVFRALVEKIEQEYITKTDYNGLPMLNDNWISLQEIYNDAPEVEKRMIFSFIVSRWDTLFRHWKTFMDDKYEKGKWQKHFE